jgi:hypothetical protein
MKEASALCGWVKQQTWTEQQRKENFLLLLGIERQALGSDYTD